jgi:SpoVK/Ycf46/Vps4 family AAA+-type ATPase
MRMHMPLTDAQLTQLAIDSEGFSGADLKTLCTDAAMEPVRKLERRKNMY